MTEAEKSAFLDELREKIGGQSAPQTALDPINQPMIRHWCDAMEDQDPVYTDPEFAAKSVHGQIVAPPTMLMTWTMPGLAPRPAGGGGNSEGNVLGALDDAGFTSVVATGTEHEYLRYLRLGDLLTGVQRLESVSEEKRTALGVGHFVTTVTEYRNQEDEVVGRMKFVLLKFKPGTGRTAPTPDENAAPEPRPRRPRPGISQDTRFFWEGLEQGELRIQQCTACSALHHPPVVRCPKCGSYELGHSVAGGKGTLYSFVEPCHPRMPFMDYPYIVGLVELEEGTRLITNIVEVDPEQVEIGMPLELAIQKPDRELALPFFRPLRPARRTTTLRFEEVEEGEALPACSIPITRTSIVATAIASRDYQDVHHDPELAAQRGSPDIFMNILTTTGLCGRYASDWAGPEALIRGLKIRLGVPNYPHDTMLMSAKVLSKRSEAGKGIVELGLRGRNRIGDHVTGSMEIELPSGATS
ncbi:MAG: MaoC family dehydratase N-terminal domain-containing protein [Deltaproteobacteria bacterium]|nr:MaoC family dehydratase N-terminal domain-containing protein [Deltaproteobacteria bacterium]MBW2420421.1 MaoC family dehydratase N-terminal domain-containing protein [Deltaproteobacteria bacterium]